MKKKYGLILLVAVLAFPVQGFSQEAEKVPTFLQQRYEQRKIEMAPFDLNRNGSLDIKELTASIGTNFKAADKNSDGLISAEESAGLVDNFKETQQKIYGDMTDSRAKGLSNRLEMADVNKDGNVSWAEYSAYFSSRYLVFDVNKDGKIDETEYRTNAERVPQQYYKDQEKK